MSEPGNVSSHPAQDKMSKFENLSNREVRQLIREQRRAQRHGHSERAMDPATLEQLHAEHRKRAKRGVGLAGDIVGDVAKGLGGNSNPVGGIVKLVAKGLKRGAGET